MGQFKGFNKVFSFTFGQQVKGKNFRITLVVVALLLLILPSVILGLIERGSDKDNAAVQEETETPVQEVVVVDLDTAHAVDYSVLNAAGDAVFDEVRYVAAGDMDAANQQTGSGYALILQVKEADNYYDMQVLVPEDSKLTKEDGKRYQAFVESYFPLILQAKSGMTPEQIAAVQQEIPLEIQAKETENVDPFANIRTSLSFVLPYLTIMILYFMILAYGQGIANNVIQEKSSKLMDNLLVSVKPGALIMGKVLALFTTGVLQTFLWVGCLVAGIAIGVRVVYWINPDSTMLFVKFVESIGMFSGVFNVVGIIFALLIFLAGFLLYCALASFGGSLASKQEELGSTSMLFSMALIVSFMVAMFGGALSGSVSQWMIYVPFIAVLVAPGQAMLGELSVMEGCISLGILVVSAVVIVWLAGKVYRMMAFYKGNPPSVNKLIQMMKHRLK
ncbi:MAG: ABC transporter permease [Lachnospiraceae bacterium]|nr:ABC transporter permease [Lachnospiraceae bacterium]